MGYFDISAELLNFAAAGAKKGRFTVEPIPSSKSLISVKNTFLIVETKTLLDIRLDPGFPSEMATG